MFSSEEGTREIGREPELLGGGGVVGTRDSRSLQPGEDELVQRIPDRSCRGRLHRRWWGSVIGLKDQCSSYGLP